MFYNFFCTDCWPNHPSPPARVQKVRVGISNSSQKLQILCSDPLIAGEPVISGRQNWCLIINTLYRSIFVRRFETSKYVTNSKARFGDYSACSAAAKIPFDTSTELLWVGEQSSFELSAPFTAFSASAARFIKSSVVKIKHRSLFHTFHYSFSLLLILNLTQMSIHKYG